MVSNYNENTKINNDDRIINFKRTTLTVFLSVLLLFSLFITIRNLVAGSILLDPAYVIGLVLSTFFLILNVKGYYRFVTISASIMFTILLTIRFLFGPFRELNIIYFAIIIVATLLLTSERFAYLTIFYIISFVIVHFLISKDKDNIHPDYLLFSLLALVLISLFCILNIQVLKLYIRRISKHSDELENEVLLRTEDLLKSKEYSEMLFQLSPCAIYTTDIHNYVVDFNTKAESITGYSKEEVLGKKFEIYCKDHNVDNNVTNECKIITKDGREKIIERHSSWFHNKNGAIIGNIEIFIDLTNWRELEDFKVDIERIIRHDLKTPLNSILGFPKLMLEDTSITDENKKYLQIILDSGFIMKNLIESSQYLYKIENGTYRVNYEATEIFSILKQIEIDLIDMSKKKKCPFHILLNNDEIDSKSQLFISTEKILLYMILSNLIKNALEASPNNNDIIITVSNERELAISIHNNGTIPHEIRDTFFNKYVTSSLSV